MNGKEKPTTKICKYCKSEIPYDAKVCPNCRKKQKHSGCLIVVAVIAVLLVLAIIGSSSGTSSSSANSTSSATSTGESTASAADTETTQTTEKSVYGVGETAEQSDIKVTLVDAQTSTGANYVTPEDGKVFVLLEFEIENDSANDITVSSIASFEAYCDDYSINESLSAALLDNGKNTLDGDVAAGKKMNGIIGYEVPSDWQTIEVTVTPSFWSNRSVTFEITNS